MESATGIDPARLALEAFSKVAMDWQAANPAFYPHPGNLHMISARAFNMAGGKWGAVTREILDEAFRQLQAGGLLFERADDDPPPAPQPDNNNPTLTTFPGENPVQRSERPRGTRYATGARSTSFSAPQTVQTRALKYTEQQIRDMPEAERRRVFDDPEYIKACEFYYSGARA
jgi:hypothetical protein